MPRQRRRLGARLLLGGLIALATLTSPALATGPGAHRDDTDPIPAYWLLPRRTGPPVAPVTLPTPPAVTQPSSYQRALDHARAVLGSYGVALTVAGRNGVTWTGAAGVERDGATALPADEPFVIGSVSKTFVTAALLRLAEEGRMSLDDEVSRWLPAVKVARGATIRDLLAHTSGIADFYNPIKSTLLGDPTHAFTHQEVLDALGGAWFAPGSAWGYSNTNFLIAGMVLERVTGRHAEDVLAELVTAPLGLDQTWLLAGRRIDDSLIDRSWASSFWTAGAMRSTTADLAEWGASLYGGDVVDATDRTAMTTFNSDDYGLGTRRFNFGQEIAIGHTGLLGTTTSMLVYFPAEQVSVAIVANRAQVDLAGALVASAGGAPSLLELALGPGANLSAFSPSPSTAH